MGPHTIITFISGSIFCESRLQFGCSSRQSGFGILFDILDIMIFKNCIFFMKNKFSTIMLMYSG